MSTKYKFTDSEATYFVTATVVAWIDVFTRNDYKDVLLDSIRHCQKHQGLHVHAWILMPNHLHMIYSVAEEKDPALVLKNIKSFTALKIIDAVINNQKESRKGWMLDLFEKNGKANKSNFRFQFWQHENHPVLLDTNEMLEQRINYLHDNPVRAGFVTQPEDWLYSSAIDYYSENEKGLLELVLLT
jgi:putative transposase